MGILLLVQGGFYLGERTPTPGMWFVGLAALVAGALLSVGFLTPIVGGLVGLGALGIRLSLLPAPDPSLFDARLPAIQAVTMLIAVVLLGPGAFSIDSRIFGRREIIIPPHRLPPINADKWYAKILPSRDGFKAVMRHSKDERDENFYDFTCHGPDHSA